MTLPETMTAIVAATTGGADVLRPTTVPVPRPGPGEVLIRVDSASVNFADVMRRRGDAYPFPTAFPFVPGGEVAGTVAALGEGAAGPAVGTPVFAAVGERGYAQYVVAGVRQAIPTPGGLSPDVACSLIVAGATATLVLAEAARLAPGETVFVPAAAGGVGGYAVQIARLLGAGRILAGAGTAEKRARALELGATEAVDYTVADWTDRVRSLTGARGVDVALEMTGGGTTDATLGLLGPFGRMVVYGKASGAFPTLARDRLSALLYDPAPNQTITAFNLGGWFMARPDRLAAAVERLVGWVLEGQVRVPVRTILPLVRAAEAHRMLEGRSASGKIVLKPFG